MSYGVILSTDVRTITARSEIGPYLRHYFPKVSIGAPTHERKFRLVLGAAARYNIPGASALD